jgi:hypothetical protein
MPITFRSLVLVLNCMLLGAWEMQAAVLQISVQSLPTSVMKNVAWNVQSVRVNVAVKDLVQMVSDSVVSCQVNLGPLPSRLGCPR